MPSGQNGPTDDDTPGQNGPMSDVSRLLTIAFTLVQRGGFERFGRD